jgi:ABC-type multidrug transport system fused ATPase/permease subunit
MKLISNFKRTKREIFSCWKLSDLKTKSLLKATVVIGVIAAVIEYGFALTLQLFFINLGFLPNNGSSFSLPSPSMGTISGVLLGVALIRSLSEGMKIFVSRLAQQSFAQHVRLRLIETALHTGPSSGKVISLFSDETTRASTAILNMATIFIQISLAITLLVLSLVNFPVATVLSLALLILCYAPLKFFERRVSNEGLRLSEEWEKTNYVLTEGIRNNHYLRIIGMVEDEIKRAQNYLSRYFLKYKKAFILISLRTSVPSLFAIFILISIAYAHQDLSFFGTKFQFLEFFYLFLRFTQSISQTVTSIGDFKINSESTERLTEWLDHNRLLAEIPAGNLNFEPSTFTLHVKDLCFSHNNKKLLDQVNFDLNEGDVLVIRGESGSGKSTLIHLLLGLLKPEQGEINYCGRKLHEIKKDLIQKISYVGPHAFTIEGSIKENILYGNQRKVSNKDIEEALDVSVLSKFIEELPHGIETSINEIGSRLSTGQKQRMMIARALLRRPKIIIFDEGTANLDDTTEAQLIKNLRPFLKDKISIFVTHKDSFKPLATKQITL